jgi:hypothetical protein
MDAIHHRRCHLCSYDEHYYVDSMCCALGRITHWRGGITIALQLSTPASPAGFGFQYQGLPFVSGNGTTPARFDTSSAPSTPVEINAPPLPTDGPISISPFRDKSYIRFDNTTHLGYTVNGDGSSPQEQFIVVPAAAAATSAPAGSTVFLKNVHTGRFLRLVDASLYQGVGARSARVALPPPAPRSHNGNTSTRRPPPARRSQSPPRPPPAAASLRKAPALPPGAARRRTPPAGSATASRVGDAPRSSPEVAVPASDGAAGSLLRATQLHTGAPPPRPASLLQRPKAVANRAATLSSKRPPRAAPPPARQRPKASPNASQLQLSSRPRNPLLAPDTSMRIGAQTPPLRGSLLASAGRSPPRLIRRFAPPSRSSSSSLTPKAGTTVVYGTVADQPTTATATPWVYTGRPWCVILVKQWAISTPRLPVKPGPSRLAATLNPVPPCRTAGSSLSYNGQFLVSLGLGLPLLLSLNASWTSPEATLSFRKAPPPPPANAGVRLHKQQQLAQPCLIVGADQHLIGGRGAPCTRAAAAAALASLGHSPPRTGLSCRYSHKRGHLRRLHRRLLPCR